MSPTEPPTMQRSDYLKKIYVYIYMEICLWEKEGRRKKSHSCWDLFQDETADILRIYIFGLSLTFCSRNIRFFLFRRSTLNRLLPTITTMDSPVHTPPRDKRSTKVSSGRRYARVLEIALVIPPGNARVLKGIQGPLTDWALQCWSRVPDKTV